MTVVSDIQKGDWIDWTGGENPISDLFGKVEYRHRDGSMSEGSPTRYIACWRHGDAREDIIAYRVVSTPALNTSAEPVRKAAENEHVALPEPQVGEGERIEAAVERLNFMAEMTTVSPTALDAYGRCKATFGDLRTLLASHEAQAAKIKSLKKGLREIEIRAVAAGSMRHFDMADETTKIRRKARAVIEGAPS